MKKLILMFVLAFLFAGTNYAANNEIPLIGSKAAKFTAETTNGKITFPNDFGNSWKILFSHPQDFTPVCTSELLELAYMQDEFKELGVEIAVISTDDVNTHKLWKEHLEGLDYKDRGTFKIDFPIIDDSNAKIARQYGMIHDAEDSNKDIRGVFILDGDNTIRSINFYPMEVGRNMKEIVRIVEALKTTQKEKVMTPANWNQGDDVIIPYNPTSYSENADNSNIDKEYYSVGNRLWFKRISE